MFDVTEGERVVRTTVEVERERHGGCIRFLNFEDRSSARFLFDR